MPATLSRDVSLTFQRFHIVRAKAGTQLEAVQCGDGVRYAIPPHSVETDSYRSGTSLFAHDARHYFIWAPSDAVTLA